MPTKSADSGRRRGHIMHRAEPKYLMRTVFAIAFAGLIFAAGTAQSAPLSKSLSPLGGAWASRPMGAPVPCCIPQMGPLCWPRYSCDSRGNLRCRPLWFNFSKGYLEGAYKPWITIRHGCLEH